MIVYDSLKDDYLAEIPNQNSGSFLTKSFFVEILDTLNQTITSMNEK